MAFITLVYGPYEANGIIRHRPQRLHGLLECLTSKGYEVELVESEHLNRLTVEMKERVIFQCDIRNLLFNLSCDDDVVCQRIMNAIFEAETRFYSDANVPMFVSVKEGKRYIQLLDKLETKNLFESDVALWYEIGLERKRKSELGEVQATGEKSEAIKEVQTVKQVKDLIDEIIKEKLDEQRLDSSQEKLLPDFYAIADFLPEDIELYAKEFEKLRPSMSALVHAYREDEPQALDHLPSITKFLEIDKLQLGGEDEETDETNQALKTLDVDRSGTKEDEAFRIGLENLAGSAEMITTVSEHSKEKQMEDLPGSVQMITEELMENLSGSVQMIAKENVQVLMENLPGSVEMLANNNVHSKEKHLKNLPRSVETLANKKTRSRKSLAGNLPVSVEALAKKVHSKERHMKNLPRSAETLANKKVRSKKSLAGNLPGSVEIMAKNDTQSKEKRLDNLPGSVEMTTNKNVHSKENLVENSPGSVEMTNVESKEKRLDNLPGSVEMITNKNVYSKENLMDNLPGSVEMIAIKNVQSEEKHLDNLPGSVQMIADDSVHSKEKQSEPETIPGFATGQPNIE